MSHRAEGVAQMSDLMAENASLRMQIAEVTDIMRVILKAGRVSRRTYDRITAWMARREAEKK